MESTILIKSVKDSGSSYEVCYLDKEKEWNKKVFKSVPGVEHLIANHHITWTVEKNDKGYWNVTSVREAILPDTKQPTQPEKPQETKPSEPQAISKHDDNRSYALSYAKDFAIAKIAKGINVRSVDVLSDAEIFYQYLTGGIIPVEEEKKIEPKKEDVKN